MAALVIDNTDLEFIPTDPEDDLIPLPSRTKPYVYRARNQEWSTTDALLLVQGCVDYCNAHHMKELNLRDPLISWQDLVDSVKWASHPKTAQACFKKLNNIQQQWKSPIGSLAELVRQVLREHPIFGPEPVRMYTYSGGVRPRISRRVQSVAAIKETQSNVEDKKRRAPSYFICDDAFQQPSPKKHKYEEVIDILQKVVQSDANDLSTSRQNLCVLQQQVEQLNARIKLIEEDVRDRESRQEKNAVLLQMAQSAFTQMTRGPEPVY